jgi:phosphoadenosine phosphosulfate reductase
MECPQQQEQPRHRPKAVATRGPWSAGDLDRANERLDGAPVEEILRWGFDEFGPDICLATSFGPQSIVLMHQVARLRPETSVFYLDTDLLFPETYALRDRLAERLGLTFTRLRPELSIEDQAGRYGARLWARNPDHCCHLRKVQPLLRFLASRRAWITGIRNGHTAQRARSRVVEWDAANALVKMNPLIRWTKEQVWDYLRAEGLPFNPLHLEGYPSIGCQPCTRAIQPGEDERAGRWAGFAKTECGIHGHQHHEPPQPVPRCLEAAEPEGPAV